MWRYVIVMSVLSVLFAAITSRFRTMSTISTETNHPAPVYYFSHGGPTFMYEDEPDGDDGAFKKVQEIGKEIIHVVKPKGIIVFSGHWQATRDSVEVNTSEKTNIIYDFYGFPRYMYEEKYPSTGSKEIAEKVLNLFSQNGIKAQGVSRGLDHGVWVPFKVAFSPKNNPLSVPIVQVSLYGNEDPNKHYELGKALAPLRDEGIVIIGSGMTVHNLRDRMRYPQNEAADFSKSFDEALKIAVTTNIGEDRKQALAEVTKRSDARKAHPTFDHLMPMHVAAGAAHNEEGKQLYSNQVWTFAWGQYRFGSLPA